jgi:hypothetical protein
MPMLMTGMTYCELGDWIAIAVLICIGLFSLTFLALGTAVFAKYLLESGRTRRANTT